MRIRIAFLSGTILLVASAASAEDGRFIWSGDWYLKVGATGFIGPKYEGSSDRMFQAAPLVSLGKAGSSVRFSSRNDNMSYALLDHGGFRAGVVGKLIFERDEDRSSDLKGLDPVKFGGEVGGFAEVYPTDWMRLRAEVRQGIRSHHGVVADVAADAFVDISDTVRVSGGPRLTAATSDYFDTYYGVNNRESAASGLSAYDPGGGIHSAGLGAAITWQATEKLETSAYTEYRRLMGPAADSSLVRERGSRNQLLVGVSATYRFDFTLP
ncbi:MipA/OmpV family protein [Sinorhizobium mexicanum]|uniref:MipA/OmpV family protein n=1 Tax=Sinorhizobium mexicanum TaxID=375549 RepID=A0A859QU54_9HYPH|nr:MipA/OmpV family protein [Sinorhizobium mexicanum]MBP1883072.1 outer membrane scaffolding protein for murein synthesis (MipA/OmpV family) [Sinorhizobium mexicanum]QLL60798.1 MipA/OmpV family protein [Sinorhizobium mexicanum]